MRTRTAMIIATLAISAVLLLLDGCCTSKECQLEKVAKDWCMTIRASQVIPVYPLTEDIQPGDIFLVQVPIDQQQTLYEDKGFLPLDNHLARLNPNGYTEFYHNSFFGDTNGPLLPRDWMRPGSTNVHDWEPAPHAAFPTYSFSVRRGAGLNLAVPVEGVPVGLSLLGSDAADGSVSIKQASTLGVDVISLNQQLSAWARTNSSFLNNYAATAGEKETNYLRVITRVYITGEMDVSLRNSSSQSGGLDVGAAKPVNLLFPQQPQAGSNVASVVAENYTNGLSVLNDLLQKATSATGNFAPGGSLRITAASARTVALQEQFDPPLALGYLGFDCAILPNGRLGPPIPTHAHLDRKARLQHAKVAQYNNQIKEQIDAYNSISKVYSNASSDVQKEIQRLAQEAKLTSQGDGPTWLQGLGAIVDGSDRAKTEAFTQLSAQVEAMTAKK